MGTQATYLSVGPKTLWERCPGVYDVGMRLALSLVLVLLSPGAPAWGQVARAIPRALPPTTTPAIGGFVPRLSPSLGLSLPTTLPSFQPSIPFVSIPQTVGVTVSPALRIRSLVTSASPSPSVSPKAVVSAQLAEMAKSAAPHIESAADAGSSAAEGREAGAALEAVLTGRRPVFSAASPVTANFVTPTGFRPLHDDGSAGLEAAPAEPTAEVPAPARRAFTLYTAGVSTVKVGIETLNLVVPILLLTQYGTATMLGALFVAAQVAGLAAGAALSPLIDRLGPAKTLAASATLQAAVVGVIPLTVWLGVPLALPVLFGVFALNGALTGVFDIARRSAPPAILGNDEGVLRRYNARLYIARELAAMGAVFGAGWLLHSVGALATLGVHPAAYAAAAGFFFLLTRTSRALARPSPAGGRGSKPEGDAQKGTSRWAELAAGARIVMADPALRLAALVNIPVIALHNMFHAMLAAVYATSVLGSPAMAAVLIGAWNAGELAAALFLERRGQKTGAAGWVRYAALAGLSGWALWAFPSIWVAAPVAFLLASATLGNEIGLNSFFQAAAPKERTAAVTGFVYSSATGAAMLVMLAMGWVFDAFGALPGFLALAAAMTATSALYLLAARALARRTAATSTRSS